MTLEEKTFCLFSRNFKINECWTLGKSFNLLVFVCLFWFWFYLFRAVPAAYGGSQARDQIEAVAADLHHSHSNAGSKPRLQPTTQLLAMPDHQPTDGGQGLMEARDGTCVLMDSFPLSHDRNSNFSVLICTPVK